MISRKMPLLMLLGLLALILWGNALPLPMKQFFYTLSLTIKSLIICILPVLVFGLLLKATINLSQNATRILALILVGVVCSNFLSTMLSHYVGMMIYQIDLSVLSPDHEESLQPLWQFQFPKLASTAHAMFGGIFVGLLAAILKIKSITTFSERFETIINLILKLLKCIVPFFVLGFIVKLQHDGLIAIIVQDYSVIFAVITASLVVYLFSIYFIFNDCQLAPTMNSIKNLLPASLAGFLGMSSAAAMPLTILGAKANAKQKDLANSIIPATVNVHLIGDCFAIPILAYAVLKSFGLEQPDLLTYTQFTLYFVLAKFSVAAVPGGGILVMLPILQNNLGFTTDMQALITALYLLFDPIITAANVLGNGAFAKMIDTVVSKQFGRDTMQFRSL